MTRFILPVILVLHGMIHLMGFVVSWRIAEIEDLPYKTTVLAGNLDLGETGIRVVGLLWLILALGFVIAAIALFTRQPWWQTFTLWVTLSSLVLTILGWPDSQFGAIVNVGLLAFLFFFS